MKEKPHPSVHPSTSSNPRKKDKKKRAGFKLVQFLRGKSRCAWEISGQNVQATVFFSFNFSAFQEGKWTAVFFAFRIHMCQSLSSPYTPVHMLMWENDVSSSGGRSWDSFLFVLRFLEVVGNRRP